MTHLCSLPTFDVPSLATEPPAMQAVALLATCGLSYWDGDGRCLYANRANMEWLGIQSDILVGTAFRDLAQAIGLASHTTHADAALRGDRHSLLETFDHRHRRRSAVVQYLPDTRDGVTIGFLMQITPTPSELHLPVAG